MMLLMFRRGFVVENICKTNEIGFQKNPGGNMDLKENLSLIFRVFSTAAWRKVCAATGLHEDDDLRVGIKRNVNNFGSV